MERRCAVRVKSSFDKGQGSNGDSGIPQSLLSSMEVVTRPPCTPNWIYHSPDFVTAWVDQCVALTDAGLVDSAFQEFAGLQKQVSECSSAGSMDCSASQLGPPSSRGEVENDQNQTQNSSSIRTSNMDDICSYEEPEHIICVPSLSSTVWGLRKPVRSPKNENVAHVNIKVSRYSESRRYKSRKQILNGRNAAELQKAELNKIICELKPHKIVETDDHLLVLCTPSPTKGQRRKMNGRVRPQIRKKPQKKPGILRSIYNWVFS